MRRAPFLTFFVAAFLAFVAVPIVGIVVVEIRAERARERPSLWNGRQYVEPSTPAHPARIPGSSDFPRKPRPTEG